MTANRVDPKRRANAKLAMIRSQTMATDKAALERHVNGGSLAGVYRGRGGMTAPEKTGLASFAGLKQGERIIDRSAYAVTVARDGELVGMFAIGDWGKPKCA